jgi:hypothetical protein
MYDNPSDIDVTFSKQESPIVVATGKSFKNNLRTIIGALVQLLRIIILVLV